ncbi:MAG: rod shape-determining protein MreD [Bacteroidaceae bacterium]
MVHIYIRRLLWFAGLLLVQVLVLNHIHIAGYATPFLYIYFLLKMDTGVSRNALMLWGFFLGLTLDMFSCTPGMNAAAAVFLAASRPLLLRLFSSRDKQENFEPGFGTIGTAAFCKYVVMGTLMHHTFLLTLEAFSFFNLPMLLLKIAASSLFSILCILSLEGIKR